MEDNTEQEEQTAFFRQCLQLGWEQGETFAKARQKWPEARVETLEALLEFAVETPLDEESITAYERVAILAAIAKGEIEVETKELRYNPKTQELIPFQKIGKVSNRDRIAALAELNRMAENMPGMSFEDGVIVVEPRLPEDED